MFGDWIRRIGFWTLDAIKGGEIRKFYNDIALKNANTTLNQDQLERLLEHAATTTEFYKSCNPKDFFSFPIIDKNIIKQKWDDLYSSLYKGKNVHHMSTSGSTGTPFVMDWDMEKRKRQLAALIYYNELAGQKLGQRSAYFRVWTKRNEKTKMEQFIQNLIPIDIIHLDEEHLKRIRERLIRKPYINSCLGYASTYEYLIKYLQSIGDTPDMYNIRSFISGSEVLSDEMKVRIKKTVGCQVIDRYSNEENGFLAQSADMSDIFNVNVADFLIEILKEDSNEPAKIGERGRIIVTDLYSFAVPLIRYDTGDLAVKECELNGWVTALRTIQGRRVDVIYDTKGNIISPHAVTNNMWDFDKIRQYQLIQNTLDEFVLKLNMPDGVYSDDEIILKLKSFLGEDAKISIDHVEGIPALASGKFKKTICNYKPE